MLIAAVSYPGLVREAQAAADALAEKVAQSPVLELPFPHLCVDGALPSELCSGLLEDFPGDALFEQGRFTSRGRQNLDRDSEVQRRLVESSAAWSVFAEAVESATFRTALMRRFSAQLRLHGCHFDADTPTGLGFDVSRAKAPYQRGCHLDRRRHLIQMLFYLNGPEDYAPEGGELLLFGRRRRMPRVFDKFPAADDIEVARRITPAANRLVVMLNTSTSYHGVEPLRASEGWRKFIYAAVDPVAPVDDAWPETTVVSEARRQAFLAE